MKGGGGWRGGWGAGKQGRKNRGKRERPRTWGVEALHGLVARLGGGGAVEALVLEAAQAHVVCKC